MGGWRPQISRCFDRPDHSTPGIRLGDERTGPRAGRGLLLVSGTARRIGSARHHCRGCRSLGSWILRGADWSRRLGIYLACLWIDRSSCEFDEKVDIANIIGEFVEPLPGPVDHMVVMMSVVSGTCVVRTSLQSMLEEVEAKAIHVAAPVVLEGAQLRLAREFPADLASRFRYWFIAEDDQKNDRNEVVPGVGGNLYFRLGFASQKSKNAFIPKFVLERMSSIPEPEIVPAFP